MAFSRHLPVLATIAAFVVALTTAQVCREPDYLQALKNQVRDFYEFYQEPSFSGLTAQNPCSLTRGNLIARPRRPVSTLETWHSQRSTCPWYNYVDEDLYGRRFPCRLDTARLLRSGPSSSSSSGLHAHRPQPCLRIPGTRHHRYQGKLCEKLVQQMPVVAHIGCRNGINDYTVTNITITVGYTCTFEQDDN